MNPHSAAPPPLPPKLLPQNNKLNINLPDNSISNTVLRLEVELRDKHSSPSPLTPGRRAGPLKPKLNQQHDNKIAKDDLNKFIVPMEKVIKSKYFFSLSTKFLAVLILILISPG